MKAGGYVLHLSCDYPGCRQRHREYFGSKSEAEAIRAAKREGWRIGKPWTAPDYCKEHRGTRHEHT